MHTIKLTLFLLCVVSTWGWAHGDHKKPYAIDVTCLQEKTQEYHQCIVLGSTSTHVESTVLNQIIKDWKTYHGDFGALQAYSPQFKKLNMQPDEGFHANWYIKTSEEREYNFYFWSRLDEEGKLESRASFIQDVKRFLEKFEKDKRGKVVLAQNRSGHPIVISEDSRDGAIKILAKHPYHHIRWNPKTDETHFQFMGEYDALKKFPEVKKIMRHKEAKKIIKKSPNVRIRGAGSSKGGYQFVVMNPEGGKPINLDVK